MKSNSHLSGCDYLTRQCGLLTAALFLSLTAAGRISIVEQKGILLRDGRLLGALGEPVAGNQVNVQSDRSDGGR